MIEVEGYKAFHGKLIVSPVSQIEPFALEGDFLYKPEYNCWYGCGRSFPAEICRAVEELPEASDHNTLKTVIKEYNSEGDYIYKCPDCSKRQKNNHKNRTCGCFCERCGSELKPFDHDYNVVIPRG